MIKRKIKAQKKVPSKFGLRLSDWLFLAIISFEGILFFKGTKNINLSNLWQILSHFSHFSRNLRPHFDNKFVLGFHFSFGHKTLGGLET